MKRFGWCAALFATPALLFLACADATPEPDEIDAGTRAPRDGSLDSSGDAKPDAPSERDAGVDATSDAPADADADASTDALADVDADASGDAGSDGDASSDGAAESGPDAADAGSDATADAGADSGPVFVPPVADGTIGAGEYGSHVDGANQQASDPNSSTSTTWYMTWDNTNLYVGVAFANVNEAVVLYLDTDPTNSTQGLTVGQPYDSTRASTLPFRADFVLYAKTGYAERRSAAALDWDTAHSSSASSITHFESGSTREIIVPWSVIGSGARPASFSWLGYATSNGGFVYGQMPRENPSGSIGQNSAFARFYLVPDGTPGTGSKPFAALRP